MIRLAALLLVSTWACVCQGQVDFFQPRIKTASACGFIVDRSGQGIPRAALALTNEDGTKSETNSDEHGRFTFVQSSGSGWTLDVHVAGFIPASGIITKLRLASASRCDKPIYVVMGVGVNDYSYLTTNRTEIQKLKKAWTKGKDKK